MKENEDDKLKKVIVRGVAAIVRFVSVIMIIIMIMIIMIIIMIIIAIIGPGIESYHYLLGQPWKWRGRPL